MRHRHRHDGVGRADDDQRRTCRTPSFKLSKVRIGDHNYLGNNIHYPADGKTGANCLLGTKVMIPIDGPVRENVGLLGSPSFEIPRAVERDKHLNPPMDDEVRREQLSKKNRYNLMHHDHAAC